VAIAYVALGSNLGDRAALLEGAVGELASTHGVRVLRRSKWIDTAPVGGPVGQPRFLNGVVELDCELEPEDLLARLLEIERRHGRVRAERNGPRTLDLDLLLFDARRVSTPRLEVPHPRLEEREFVLAPLAELAPELRLAKSGLTVRERLAQVRGACNAAERGHASAAMTHVCRDPLSARSWLEQRRPSSLGFVPTMGALHEGHLTLIRRARRENEVVCVSVFVNPLQFNDASDFERYPRDFDADAARVGEAGCDMVFSGTLWDFFPEAKGDRARIPLLGAGPAALGLEGEFRPGHFDGVATIVVRLFEFVRPTRAYFGAKDFQQTLVVRDVARRMGYPEVVVCATSRESSGLARSSRNELLSAEWRARAPAIYAALADARTAWRERGVRSAAELRRIVEARLAPSGLQLEYAQVRDPLRWSADEPAGELERAVALVAVRAGGVRLIDNLRLDRDEAPA
jgi:pantoate--beta-alanine ligase